MNHQQRKAATQQHEGNEMNCEELLTEVQNNLQYNDKYYIDWMWNEVYERTCIPTIPSVKAYSECEIRWAIEGIEGVFMKIDGVFYKRIIAHVSEPKSMEKLNEILEELKS